MLSNIMAKFALIGNGLDLFMSIDEARMEVPHNIKDVFAGGWNPALAEGAEQVKTLYLLWTFSRILSVYF